MPAQSRSFCTQKERNILGILEGQDDLREPPLHITPCPTGTYAIFSSFTKLHEDYLHIHEAILQFRSARHYSLHNTRSITYIPLVDDTLLVTAERVPCALNATRLERGYYTNSSRGR